MLIVHLQSTLETIRIPHFTGCAILQVRTLDRAGVLLDPLNPQADEVEIWVAAGTYYPDEGDGLTGGDQNLSFELTNHVRIYGGFSGGETVLNDRDPVRNVTILSGDLADDDDPDDPFNTGLTDDNSLNIVICDGDAATALLDGFTVTGATGSGVFLSFCSPSIVRCNITKNRSDAGGGARAKSGSPLFYNCSFFENRAENSAGSGAGGGFHVGAGALASSALLINCLFHDNEALGTFGDGGGLYIQWRISHHEQLHDRRQYGG